MLQHADQTLTKLRQLIASGGLGASGRIPPERTLANEMGVGRRSLRRALEILEQEGQITRHQGRGTFVQDKSAPVAAPTMLRPRDGDLAGRLGDVRDPVRPHPGIHQSAGSDRGPLAVEPVIARLAALRASQADIRRLQLLVSETREATDPAVYEKADEKFHRAVAEAARNALFLSLFDTLSASRRDATWRRLSENAHCFKRQSVHSASHQEIYEAIAARNSERAFECMYRHLSDVQRHVYTYAFPAEQKSVAE
jgi:DNA-binding FadR family transcriptional regulator